MRNFGYLMAKARAGDRDALQSLFERHRRSLANDIRRRLHGDVRRQFDTDDLMQSVFLGAMRDIGRFEDRGEAAFRNWLFIKARNAAWGKVRRVVGRGRKHRERRWPSQLELVDPSRTPSDVLARDDERDRVRALTRQLAPERQQLLWMRYDSALSYAEIARRLGLPSADAVRKRLARTLRTLTQLWD